MTPPPPPTPAKRSEFSYAFDPLRADGRVEIHDEQGNAIAEVQTIKTAEFVCVRLNSYEEQRLALESAQSALTEAALDYNHPSFTDRRGAGWRMSAALLAVRTALSERGGV